MKYHLILSFMISSFCFSQACSIDAGGSAVVYWNSTWSYCEGCTLQAYPDYVTFQVIRRPGNIVYNVGKSTSYKCLDIQENTELCIIARCPLRPGVVDTFLYSHPSTSVFAYVDDPGPVFDHSISFCHTAEQFAEYWHFDGENKFKDDRYCICAPQGLSYSSLDVFVEHPGPYFIQLSGYRHDEGTAIVCMGDLNSPDIRFVLFDSAGNFGTTFDLTAGETTLFIVAKNTSICLSSITSKVTSNYPVPYPPSHVGIRPGL